ncbi:hypothetical protein [Synechococcus sp. CCY 9618]|uniref:hypothetical protein n=1 Tax=Synechococcus sp. CCY 9618 TaxID=2815602 RepID=UPI001C2352F6|nr:hypothetical protein [Synechococcus sp. CCY 9618]
MRLGLLGLLVATTCGASNQAMALTFTGDPAADGWSLLGNSSDPAYFVRGTNSFNLYTTTFTLGSTDTVDLGPNRFPYGDAFLYNGDADTWDVGDTILGFGVSGWGSGAGGYPSTEGSLFFLKFDPAGTGVFGNAASGKTNNDAAIYQSPGSFTFDFNSGTQNRNEGAPPKQPYQTFLVQDEACPTPFPCSSTLTPYYSGGDSLLSNGNNQSTTGAGTLPMRSFGIQAGSETSWSSFQIFINTALLPEEVGTFGSNSKFSFSSWNFGTAGVFDEAAGCLNPLGCTAPSPAPDDDPGGAPDGGPTGAPAAAPGPLPLLGVSAAFGFSRRLRRRIKGSGSAPRA